MWKINRIIAIISIVIVVALMLGAIVILYLVTNNNAWLGLIYAFTIAFALSIYLLTNA
jgi:uncharacterized protein (DUF983 family)